MKDEQKEELQEVGYNVDRDLHIDESALDVEWLQQPRLFMKYASAASDKRRAADKAKEQLELVKANLDSFIRKDPAEYDIAKVTEATVANAILKEDEYKDAMSDYIDAKHEYELTQAAVRAMDQRKTALEDLVRLHGQQYFAGPREPRDLPEEVKKQRREEGQQRASQAVNQKVAGKMKRSK